MGVIASRNTSLTIVYSTVYSRRRSKKTSELRVIGLCARNSPGTGEFPAQMASYAENVFIWWRHHDVMIAVTMYTERHMCLRKLNKWIVRYGLAKSLVTCACLYCSINRRGRVSAKFSVFRYLIFLHFWELTDSIYLNCYIGRTNCTEWRSLNICSVSIMWLSFTNIAQSRTTSAGATSIDKVGTMTTLSWQCTIY